MRVLYDHATFCQHYGGASKYFTEIIKRLPPSIRTLSLLLCNNAYLSEASIHKSSSLQRYLLTHYPKTYRINWLSTGWQLHTADYDVYHPTSYAPKWLWIPKRKKVVMTFHDLTVMKFPQYFDKPYRELSIAQQREAADRADYIIAISQNTKNDLINAFGTSPDKIKVIYHGVEESTVSYMRLYEAPYILYVGARTAYKNFTNCVIAFKIIHSKYPELHLVCTGSPFTRREQDFFMELGIQSYVSSISASEVQMDALYQHAEVFVYPSFYEGFGMPILEAMRNGCPVALSNTSCFPEIAGDSGVYFNPSDPEEMASVMEQLILNKDLRQNIIRKGNDKVQNFSWDKCAKEHLLLYESLL